jgi:RNA polymerase sigma factor (TIGR02999 family)
MSEFTQILKSAEEGDPQSASQLLPLVYDELRRLAGYQMSREKPGQTLNATGLVHEAYLRLMGPDAESVRNWDGRRHFFAAAAEAMRRILVENARRKQALKHGGGLQRQSEDPDLLADAAKDPLEVLAIHETLEELAAQSPRKAELVKLRYFLGCTMAEASQALGVSHATAEEDWTYAKAWLQRQWQRDQAKKPPH